MTLLTKKELIDFIADELDSTPENMTSAINMTYKDLFELLMSIRMIKRKRD